MITKRIARDALSFPQFLLLFWGALLSPFLESFLPFSGRVSLLSPLLVAPVVFFVFPLLRGVLGENQGLHQGLRCVFGEILGKILLFAYFLWGVVLLSYQILLCGLSFLSVGYAQGSLWLILPILCLFLLWMAGANLASFARASSFFVVIILLVITIVLGFSLDNLKLSRVFPLDFREGSAISRSVLTLLGLYGYGIYTSFFWGDVVVEPGKKQKKQWFFSVFVATFLLTAYLFLCLATFGEHLLVEIPKPFYTLAKSVALEGGFQRVESVVIALCALGDFVLLGVLVRGTSLCAFESLPKLSKPWTLRVLLVISTIIALVLGDFMEKEWILWGNILLAWLIPGVMVVVSRLSGKSKKNACNPSKDVV